MDEAFRSSLPFVMSLEPQELVTQIPQRQNQLILEQFGSAAGFRY